jgi:hypothetical protein
MSPDGTHKLETVFRQARYNGCLLSVWPRRVSAFKDASAGSPASAVVVESGAQVVVSVSRLAGSLCHES